MHLFEPFWLYKSLPDGTFYNSPFLGCLTLFWSFRTVSLWKVALFNPKAMGLVLQTKWREVSLGLAKSPGFVPTDRPAGAIYLLFDPEILFEIFLITCSQKQQWIVKRTFYAECSKSPVGRCPALDLWRGRFPASWWTLLSQGFEKLHPCIIVRIL